MKETFRNKIMNHSSLYFIVIDNMDNIFGHYHPTLIREECNCCYNGEEEIFLFSLQSNGKEESIKYLPNHNFDYFTSIENDF